MTKYVYEEKIAPLAPLCVFQDGADDVPTKSVKVAIPASLSGVSAVTETQIPSRNMASMSDADFTLNSVRYKTENGVLYIDGTSTGETSSNNNAFKALDFWLPSGTYYFNRGSLADMNVATYLRKYDDKTEIKANSGSFTLAEKTHVYISFYVYNKVFSDLKATICINIGSTAITYEDTSPVTTYTASLGRTIYGGEVDIVNGVGQEMHGAQAFSGSESWTLSGTTFWYTTKSNPNVKAGQIITASNGVVIRYSTNGQIRCYPSENVGVVDTSTDMNALFNSSVWFGYELATPTDFTFTGQEVPTRLGYNAFWSDSGDTEVTYYIQIPVEERYIIGGEILSDIADAIREKKESTAPILTENMPDEIRSIEMGGSDLFDLASQNPFDLTDETYKTNALTVPDRMFNGNQRIRTVDLSGVKTVESYAFYSCKATSISLPDVETIGYQAFWQARGATDVPLSIPNAVSIGEEAFKEAYVCGESTSNRFLDISKCVSIGHNAFRSTRISNFKLDSVETLGNNPWYSSWFNTTNVIFPKLKTAGSQMCRGITFTNLVIGPDWESCGGGFAGYDTDWRNKYVYVYATTPPTMGGDFSLWKPPVAFYVPAESVDAYKAAAYWSTYASIILPLPDNHLTIDTWL